MMPNTYDTFFQDDAEHFLVAIDKAYSKDTTNCSPSSENGFNAYKKNKYGGEQIKSKIYNAFIKVPELLQWAVLLLGPNVPFTCTVRNFIDDLCNDVECMIIRNKGVDIHWSSMEDGISTLPFLLTAITKQISHQAEVNNLFSESVNKPQLILCVIPNEGAEDYIEEIKRICKKIKITVVFINCSDIANSSSEFRNSLGEEMKEKLIQFLIEQSQEEENKRKPEDDIPKQQPKQNPSNKYVNGNNSYNQYNDQDYKSNFNELSSPKYHYSHSCNGNFESSPNSSTKGNYISPLNMGGSVSRSYQYNSPGRMDRDRHYYNNYHDDNNTLSPGWSSSKPIYFSKSNNSPSQANASYSSRNNSFSVSPSPHSSTPRRERENTFSSLRNYSYFNGQYYSGSSPINMDKKNYHNNDTSYSVSNNSDVMFTPENDGSPNKNNKHSRSNTICNGVISTQKEAVNTPRKFSGSTYSKSFGNNNYNNYNGNNKLGVRSKFVNTNNKRLSVNNSIGYHDKYNDSQYQYTNPYLEGLNLERNYRNNSYWEGRNYSNSYINKNNYPMEYKSYSYNDSKSRNSKYSKKNNNNQDGSSTSSSPTRTTFETKSNKYDRKYDIDEENYNEEGVFNKMNDLKISRSFDKENSKNDVPRYRPPIPPYNDKDNKIENEDMKIFTGSNGYGKTNDDSLSRSVPTKNFFTDRNSKKSNEVNDWNKNNKSNFKYNKYNNNNYYKSKSNDNYYDDNDLDEIVDDKKSKKEVVYNSTKSSPTRLTIEIKSTMKYRAPTPKNIMEGKYKSISPDSYYNESSKNNDTKSNHSPKKETKSPNSSNDTNKLSLTNSKIIQSPSPVPSVEKYVPPNLRNQNKYGNNTNSSTPNSKSNSFDKPVPSPNLIITPDDKLINNKSSKAINSSNKVQSELTKEIQAQQELTRNKSPLTIPNNINNISVIENKNNVISNNNSLLFNSRRHKANTRTNLNNNYNQTNDDNNMGNTYNNPNSINKYYINSVNNFDNSPNYTDSNSDSLANYYRTYK